MGKKKILFFVSPTVGGATRMTINIAKLMLKEGHQVKFIVYGGEILETKDALPKNSEYEVLRLRNIWDFPIIRMTRLFKKEKATHVFSSLVFLNLRVILAAKIAGIKAVVRNDNNLSYFRNDNRILMKFIYPLADHIIAQQEEMRDELTKYLPSCKDKIIALQNIFDSQLVDKNIKADNPYNDNASVRYVWSGRLQPAKGHDVLIKAFNIVHKKLSQAHVYILGKIDNQNVYYNKMQQYIKQNNLENYVHFVGFQSNPHVWMKYASCFVLPSRTEGLPNALVEAMYIGKPVVVTRCVPVIERMVEDGYNGYIVPVDDIKAMAEKMIEALNLNDFVMKYKPSSPDSYIKLFD